MYKIITNILLLLYVIILVGCSVSTRLKKADRYYSNGEYYAASEIYRKTQRQISPKKKRLKAEVYYKLAESYRYTNNHSRAVRAYNSAIRYKCQDSSAVLNLAKSQLVIGRHADAKANFLKYLHWFPDSYEAQCGLNSAENFKKFTNSSTRYKVEEAREFNFRRFSDFSPAFLNSDASAIVFTSNRESGKNRKVSSITGVNKNDLFFAKKNQSGKWEKIESLSENINTISDEGVACFTSDGKTMYFTRCDDKSESSQIYQSVRSGGEWAEPSKIILFSDSTISVGHPAISPDGNFLYFVSDAPGGLGGKDIWVASNQSGNWNVLENLGPDINTTGNEMFPYVRHDGVLFFSSDGHIGLGALDIFMATKDSVGGWQVNNMMSPINSQFDDFGIIFNATSDYGYFSSNRNQNRPIDKIYRFKLPPLVYEIKGKVFDDRGNGLSETTIRIVGDNGDNVKMRTKKDGSYRILLDKDVKYVMLATHRGYLNSSFSFNTFDLNDSKTYTNNFTLNSVSKPVKLDDIFYDFGKWTLSPQSEDGLKVLVKILNDNPNIAIEISSHTDMVGSDSANDELSLKRAQSVVDYLIKLGIDSNRLTAKGYGKNKPVVVSIALAEKYKFLKEGDVLTPEYIETLSKKNQEICNSINRRTEFKVTKTTYNLY